MPFNASPGGFGAPDSRLNPALILGADIAQIPEQIRQAKMQKQQDQLTSLQILAQKQQLGAQTLQGFAQRAQGDPKLLNDPTFTAQAIAATKPFGVSVPLTDGPNGAKIMDVNALTPDADWHASVRKDPTLASKALALPKGPERQAFLSSGGYTNVPPDVLNAEQYVPLSAGAQNELEKATATQVDKLGKGDLTPGEFAGYVRTNYARLKELGQNPDFYLSKDFQRDTAGQLVKANIDRLNALGIHIKNQDAYEQASLKEKMREFDESDATKRRGQNMTYSLGEQRVGVAARNSSLAVARLGVAEKQADTALKNYQLNANKFMFGQVTSTYNALKSEYDASNRTVTTLRQTIERNVATAQANNTVYTPTKEILDQLDPAVKGSPAQRLNELQPKLASMQSLIAGNPARAFTTVTGKQARLIDDADVQAQEYGAGRAVPGQAGYTFTGATRADGAYEVRGPSGRKRYWAPD
jgi:hypothetical protein